MVLFLVFAATVSGGWIDIRLLRANRIERFAGRKSRLEPKYAASGLKQVADHRLFPLIIS